MNCNRKSLTILTEVIVGTVRMHALDSRGHIGKSMSAEYQDETYLVPVTANRLVALIAGGIVNNAITTRVSLNLENNK